MNIHLPAYQEVTWGGEKTDYEAEGARESVLRHENPDIRSLKELTILGLKGMAAYYEHAAHLGEENSEIISFICRALATISNPDADMNTLLGVVLETGKYGVDVMALLDKANTQAYGNPELTRVNIGTGSNPEMKLAHNYVSNWEEMKANASGLLIWGDVGTGKSFFAGCIANALLEKGVPVLMTNFSRILNTLTGMHFEDRNQFINSLNRYSLLIIDDLGIERNSDFALEQVFNVIDSRYRSKKPLIITTNLTLSELNNAADIAHKRIYDRILERCVPIRINNRNIRQDNATANLKKTKKILLDNHTSNQS